MAAALLLAFAVTGAARADQRSEASLAAAEAGTPASAAWSALPWPTPRLNAQTLSQSAWAGKGVVPISTATERYVRDDAAKRSERVALGGPGEAFSALFNYRIGRNVETLGESATRVDLDTHLRYRNWLIDSESAHRFSADQFEQVRLSTSAAYDIPGSRGRLTFGDQVALSGDLGVRARLFGLGVGKVSPTQPSTVYAASERLDFFDSAPPAGSMDYGYRLGLRRENYGLDSNHYGEPAFAGHQRWGLGGGRAAGMSMDASAKGWSGAGTFVSKLWGFGTFSAALARSAINDDDTGSQQDGYAASFSHRYQTGPLKARGFFRSQSASYRNPLAEAPEPQRRWLAGIDAGISAGSLGSFSALASRAEYFSNGQGGSELSLSYSKTFASRARLSASLSRSTGADDSVSALLGFTYTLPDPRAVSF